MSEMDKVNNRDMMDEYTPMHDRAFENMFADDKNNKLLSDIVNLLRGVHDLPPIPGITSSRVQVKTYHESLLSEIDGSPDVNNRRMQADLVGIVPGFPGSPGFNISVEVQQEKQADFAARAVLTSSNMLREGLESGSNFSGTRDLIGINILGFKLPELASDNASQAGKFVSRIIRSDYDTGKHFLPDKFSEYYLELPKLPGKREQVSEKYRELWDVCKIFQTKRRDMEEVISMSGITSPVATDLAKAFGDTVRSDYFADVVKRDAEAKERVEAWAEAKAAEAEAKGIAEGKAEMAAKTAVMFNILESEFGKLAKEAGIDLPQFKAMVDEIKARNAP